MMRSSGAIAAVLLNLLGLVAAGPEPRGPRSAERDRLTFNVTSVSAWASWNLRPALTPRLDRKLNVQAEIHGEGAFVERGLILTEVRDGEGHNLLEEGSVQPAPALPPRLHLQRVVDAAFTPHSRTEQTGRSILNLPRTPGRLAVLKGVAEALRADTARVPLDPDAIGAFSEPWPGIRVMIKDVKEEPNALTFDVVVRITRCKAEAAADGGCKPGLEPILGAIVGVDEGGTPLFTFYTSQLDWKETPDEYIGVFGEGPHTARFRAGQAKGLELHILHSIRPVRFEFALEDVLLGEAE